MMDNKKNLQVEDNNKEGENTDETKIPKKKKKTNTKQKEILSN